MELTQQGEIAGKELFYKSKLSLTPKRKVASYVGRLCEEGKFLLMNTFMHCRMIMHEKEIFYKSKFSLTPKRKVASYVGRLCEEGKFHPDKILLIGNSGLPWQAFLQMKTGELFG